MTAVFAFLAMPILRRMQPERAHALAMQALRLGLVGQDTTPDDPVLAQHLFGLEFRNPIGLAAGLDKDGAALHPLMRLGFGFVEAGTVTPRPQAGNPKPRLFRLAEDRALINRMGFNSKGLDAFLRNLAPLIARPVPLGVNIGPNKGADPDRDYRNLAAAVAAHAQYVTINVSSPNTPGLRDLQAPHRLRSVVQGIDATVLHRPPLLVKISPDLGDRALQDVVEVCVAARVEGLIVGNTTLDRPPGLRSLLAAELGGLSGAPLFARSTAVLARAYAMAAGRLLLIGCGGVFSGRDALDKIRAGASLVQLYTAFAYFGPAVISRIKADLVSTLRAEGFARLSDAIGADARRVAEFGMKFLPGFAPLAASYGGFIIDLWGVVHDGVTPYAGAIDCLRHIRQLAKPSVLLSNAPRRADVARQGMREMGIPDGLYTGIITSGEVTRQMLRYRTDTWFASLGRRMFHLGPRRDRNLYEGLDLERVEQPAAAEFVLNTGPDYRSPTDLTLYEGTLRACAEAGLPMICANPDLEVIRGGQAVICAGALARRYAALGGDVRWIGKPDPAVYDGAFQILALPRAQILAVGDALHTDIAGAAAAGVDSCWVLGGIHRVLQPDPAAAERAARAEHLAPAACIPAFVW